MWTVDQIQSLIADDKALSAIFAAVGQRADAEPDPGHDRAHLLRVAVWTLELGDGRIDRRRAVAAALLHDAVNPTKDSQESAQAGELSAAFARRLLPDLGFDPTAIEEIAAAIRDHSYRRGAVPDSLLGRVLQDADRLDALGAIGICRALVCGARMGSALYDPADPWARQRPLNDRSFTIDHFFSKLLALPETLHTRAGRREAQKRLAPMRSFLEHLGEEIGVALHSTRRAVQKRSRQ